MLGELTALVVALSLGPAEDAPPSVQRPTSSPPASADPGAPETPAPAKSKIPESSWNAVKGKNVVIGTSQGEVEGEVIGNEPDSIVVVAPDGQVRTIPKSSAQTLKVAKAPPAAAPPPEEPAADEPFELAPPDEGEEEEESGEEEPQDEESERKKKRQERREKREFAILGAMTAHGAAYAHWRGGGVNSGHAAYMMDWGIGGNFSQRFGLYVLGGGLLGTKIEDKSVKANYGHIALMFAFGGKYYFTQTGAGVAFNRLKFNDPPIDEDALQKDVGFAIPFRLFAKIPLPKKLYIGIGIAYQFAAFRGFDLTVNGIGGQIVFGRW